MSQKMKVWQLAEWGRQNLQIADRDIPRPGPADVLVQVRAASLNYRDKPALDGIHLQDRTPRPFTPCSDMGGEVVEIGSGVKRFQVGDRVSANFYTEWLDGVAPANMHIHGRALGYTVEGTLAEYVMVPEDAVVLAPDTLSMEEIATLPIAALTAWFALVNEGRLRAGQSVLLKGTVHEPAANDRPQPAAPGKPRDELAAPAALRACSLVAAIQSEFLVDRADFNGSESRGGPIRCNADGFV